MIMNDMGNMHDAVEMRREINRLRQEIDSLKAAVRNLQYTATTETRLTNERGTDHTHSEYLTSADLTLLGDSLGTLELQSTASITATGAGTTIDLTASNYHKFSMQLVGSAGFTSATVDFQVSNDNTNFVSIMTLAISGASTDIDFVLMSAGYVRYNVTAITAGAGSLTVIIGAQN